MPQTFAQGLKEEGVSLYNKGDKRKTTLKQKEDNDMAEIKVLALDLDGTLTNDQKEITPRHRYALRAYKLLLG